ncbi:MAG: hypothetical protein ACRDTP_00615, partial [Mycobacteriales bacterium]
MSPDLVGGLAAGAVAWSLCGERASARLPRRAPLPWEAPSLDRLESRSAGAFLAAGAGLPVAVLAGPAVGLAVAVLVAALAAELRDGLR